MDDKRKNILLVFCVVASMATVTFLAFYWNLSNLTLTLMYLVLGILWYLIITAPIFISHCTKAGRALKIITLAYCPVCGDCMPLVPENRAPVHDGDEEIPQDDCLNFVRKHFAWCSVKRLRRKYLYVLFGPFRLKRVSWSEPVKTVFFLVFIKKSGLFLLKRWRVNTEEPLKYQLFPAYHWKVPALLLKMAQGWIFG